MLVRIKDIAREAGVSVATVSRVFNYPEIVRPSTRKRVLEVARRLGYTPNHLARALRTKRTNFVAVIVPLPSEELFSFPYFGILMRGLSREAARRGFHIIFVAEESEDLVRIYRDFIQRRMADGFVILDVVDGDPRIKLLKERGARFVVIGRPSGVGNYPYVDSDNEGGAYRAVRLLCETGHRKIAFINGPADRTVSRQRLKGYMRALEEFGIPFYPELVLNGDFLEASGYALTKTLLERSPVDAIFYASDAMAIGGMHYLAERSIEVGKDISIIGFDDIPSAKTLSPPLSSVRQPIEDIGRRAMEMLAEILEGRNPQPTVFPTDLIVRGSVKGAKPQNH